MRRVWSITDRDDGFSLIEVMLATTLFGFLALALIGAVVYGRGATTDAGNRSRAIMLAEEGVEALRSIRDAGYASLADGTYGIAQSGGKWVLSGSQDSTNNFTRQITVAANGANRKTITTQVSWQRGSQTATTDVTTLLSNWRATMVRSWANPVLAGSSDAAGTQNALKVATQGNYAYFVRSDATPDFLIYDITTPTAPTLVGSLSLPGSPTNIAVNGNYAYVSNTSDTAELQIINITTPTAPSLAGSYNAAGAADGRGVYVVGTTVYVSRAANGGNNELVVLNASSPATPSLSQSYSLNVDMNEVYVANGNVYLATGSDSQELLVLGTLLGALVQASTFNLTGTTDALTIAGYGDSVAVGQGATVYIVTPSLLGNLLNLSVRSSLMLPGQINDLAFSANGSYIFAGTSFATAEFQIVNSANLDNLSILSSVDIPGTSSTLSGVAYNGVLDSVPGASSSDTQEAVVFRPN